MAKHFTAELKLEAAKLVVDHGYTYVNVAPLQGERHGSAVPMVFMPWAPFYTLRHVYSTSRKTALHRR